MRRLLAIGTCLGTLALPVLGHAPEELDDLVSDVEYAFLIDDTPRHVTLTKSRAFPDSP